ncbi:RagB/SusD family nutrient uptake outer membrane protein [Hoylesella oralis]|uniref:RagB/SusD family nutrient uptake outer membrane protein n=1 Tax=Hoylesella oralis TaxID=28134 RepID=UPI0028ED7F01|nr:RagB/SusD family nutrient uptake outer membrane protein [Hoylesella oralis]
MKSKITRMLLAVMVVAMTYGCSDELNITPDGRLTLDIIFSDSDYTEQYANSMYEYIRKYGNGYHYYTWLSAFTDDATDSQAPADTWLMLHQWNQGNFSAANPPFMAGSTTLRYSERDFWGTAFGGVRKTNVFLTRVNNMNMPNEVKRDRYMAEAHVLRAHYYFELIKNFGGVPLFAEDITRRDNFADIERASFDDCVQFIVKDCDEAIASKELPFRTMEDGQRGRMTKAVAYFIKASALLFAASPHWNPSNDVVKWQAAATAAKEALDQLVSHGYQLFPNYERFFITRPDKNQDPLDKETILEAIDTWGYGSQTYRRFGVICYLMNMIPVDFASEKCGLCPSQELVDSYEMKDGTVPILGYDDDAHTKPIINPASGYDDQKPYVDRDPRFYASVWYNGAYFGKKDGRDIYIESFVGGRHGISGIKQRTPTGYYTRKYVDPSMRSAGSSKTLWRIYRLAELYLDLAEAENEANGPTQIAYDAVNATRRRAGMPDMPTGLTKDEFRERVRRERRVEMAFEENRFYDLRRWNILVENSRLKTGMRWTKAADGTLSNERILSVDCHATANEKYYLLPIDLKEIIRMPLVKQNPGWE